MEIFKHSSDFISGQLYPTLAFSIPCYNLLLNKLEDSISEKGRHLISEKERPEIKLAAEAAAAKIKQYYQYTEGRIYTVAMGKLNCNL